MSNLTEKSKKLREMLGSPYEAVAMYFKDKKPEGAVGFKKKGGGCVAPLIFTAAKGKTVAFDVESTGYPCSAYYFGYQDTIFPGIENFLSSSEDGSVFGRECERFVDTPANAAKAVDSFLAEKFRNNAIVFKSVERLDEGERPLTVTFYADSDTMSALVFLVHYKHSTDTDRIKTGFASSCVSVFTYPLKFIEEGKPAAFWGSHDPAARLTMPSDITTLSMPFEMYEEILEVFEDSFLKTHIWSELLKRKSTNA